MTKLDHGTAGQMEQDRPRWQSTWSPIWFPLVALLLVVSLGSCGYRTGLAPSLDNGRPTRTIGIEIFGNESLLPNVERSLHAAMSESVRRFVALELTSPERADLVLRGRIADFRRRRGARDGNNRLVEASSVFVVEADLVDRVGETVVGSTRDQAVAGTPIDVPGREPAARDLALSNVADRLVLTLLGGLEYGVERPSDGFIDGQR